MKIEDLAPEQAEKFQACKTYEEFTALANEAGLELDENQAKAMRMAFDDPEAFVAHVEQAYAEGEDADISEDELKAVAGGASERDMAYWTIMTPLISPAAVRDKVISIHNKYMVM